MIVCEAVEAGRDRANWRWEEAVLQGAGGDLLDLVGDRVKVLGVQLGAEGVLLGDDAAGEVVRAVAHARADGLQVRYVALVALPSMLGVLLDVNDHAVAVPRQRGPLLRIPPLILTVHGQEAKDHQVQEGPDDRQAHEDVHEAEGHIQGLPLQGPVLLKGHKVPKSYGSQCDKTVVIRLEEAPVLVMGKGGGPDAQRAHAGEEAHRHHVLHGNVRDPHAAALLDALQEVLDEGVHALTQALEHHQCEWDAQDCVEHAESLPGVRAWGCMPIAYGGHKQQMVIRVCLCKEKPAEHR